MRLLIAVVLLAGCYWNDPSRARETLEARGFRDVEIKSPPRFADLFQCPQRTDYNDVDSCTRFAAVAPWGWKVAGVVVCPSTGTCWVLVAFEAHPAAAQPPKVGTL